MISETI